MGQKQSEVRQELIEWRQQKVLELTADGHTVREIESILKIPRATVSRDIVTLRQQAKEQIRKYIDERVPFEYHKTLAGLEGIIRNMSNIITNSSDNREIMQASTIKMQGYNLKMEMVAGANLVHEAIDLAERYRGYTQQKGKILTDGTEQPT